MTRNEIFSLLLMVLGLVPVMMHANSAISTATKLHVEEGKTEITPDGIHYRTPLIVRTPSQFGPVAITFECPFRLQTIFSGNDSQLVVICGEEATGSYSCGALWLNDNNQVCSDFDLNRKIADDLKLAGKKNIVQTSLRFFGMSGGKMNFYYQCDTYRERFSVSAAFDKRTGKISVIRSSIKADK